jgi:hypothetical protein
MSLGQRQDDNIELIDVCCIRYRIEIQQLVDAMRSMFVD